MTNNLHLFVVAFYIYKIIELKIIKLVIQTNKKSEQKIKMKELI